MINFFDIFGDSTVYFDTFDRLVEALYICDLEKRIVYINKVAEKLDGYLLKDIKGQLVTDLYRIKESYSPLLQALSTEKPIYNRKGVYYINGEEIVQICNSGPIYKNGKISWGLYASKRFNSSKRACGTEYSIARCFEFENQS